MADLTRKTANLFDKDNTTIENAYLSDNGTGFWWVGSSDSRSIKIACKSNTQYTLSVTTALPIFRIGLSDDSNPSPTGIDVNKVINGSGINRYTFTTGVNDKYIIFQGTANMLSTWINELMLNTGSTALPYEPYGWVHSLRKLTTATEAVENPLYADGTAITSYTIKGNTVQSGTPTPSAPISVNGVGDKTANLLDVTLFHNGYHINSQGNIETFTGRIATTTPIDVSNYTSVTFSYTTTRDNDNFIYATFSGNTLVERVAGKTSGFTIDTTNCDKLYLCLYNLSSQVLTADIITAMLNEGSTPLPYEPYGFKIPISSGGVTTNLYLGSTQTTREIQKFVLTGQENWNMRTDDTHIFYLVVSGMRTYSLCLASHYKFVTTSIPANLNSGEITTYLGQGVAIWTKNDGIESVDDYKYWLSQQYNNGTPVTVWYVLATETTGIVNEPLQKIGDYADSISNATPIPTTEGANSITVDTTVQPSEFSATWTGWHDASVKEWDGSQWQ